MKLYESGENYLETILILKRKNGQVRSIDIANELGFSKPSVSRAVSILKNAGLIKTDESGLIDLTNIGLSKAEGVLQRHLIITKFLNEHLGVSNDNAEKDACRIEHVISEETFEKIRKHIEE